MHMRVCYVDCHEAGLCCYLLIHMENIIPPSLQFYFHFIFRMAVQTAIVAGLSASTWKRSQIEAIQTTK
jgi:hypothetical protein